MLSHSEQIIVAVVVLLLGLANIAIAMPPENHSVDPAWMFTPEPVSSEPASIEYLARRPRDAGDVAAEPEVETYEHSSPQLELQRTFEMRQRLDMETAMKRINAVNTPILILDRHRDHNQAIFRLNYELLKEAGKDVEWKSYDHDHHAFIFVQRNVDGVYHLDPIQPEAVRDSIQYFNRNLMTK